MNFLNIIATYERGIYRTIILILIALVALLMVKNYYDNELKEQELNLTLQRYASDAQENKTSCNLKLSEQNSKFQLTIQQLWSRINMLNENNRTLKDNLQKIQKQNDSALPQNPGDVSQKPSVKN